MCTHEQWLWVIAGFPSRKDIYINKKTISEEIQTNGTMGACLKAQKQEVLCVAFYKLKKNTS